MNLTPRTGSSASITSNASAQLVAENGERDVAGLLRELNEAGVLGRIANLEVCYQRNLANMSMSPMELTELKQSNLQLKSEMQNLVDREQALVTELTELKQGHLQLKSDMQKFADREQTLVAELTEIKQGHLRLTSDMQSATSQEVRPLKAAFDQSDSASAQVIGAAQEDTTETPDEATAGNLGATATKDGNESATKDWHESWTSPILEFHGDYEFDSSIYDAAFFAFSTHVHMHTSLFITIGFLTNLAMQMGMILVLHLQFTQKPLVAGDLDRLVAWRESEGHSYATADAMAGVSLTARVCGLDAGLSVAFSQVGIIEDADNFLEFVFEGVRLGPLLCNIALILWAFTCALEMRRAIEFVEALMHVPRVKGRYTMGMHNGNLHVQGLNLPRVLLGFILAICRAAIACLLAIYGGTWLAYTTNVQNLLLNASALGFVLDIDEVIFAVMSPTHMLGLIKSVQGLRLPLSRSASFALPCMLGLLVISGLLTINLGAMDYTVSQLSHARDILCSKSTNLDFIVGVSELGRLYYAPSMAFDEAASPSVVARRDVIQLIINKKPEAINYAFPMADYADPGNSKWIEQNSLTTAEQIAENRLCEDKTGAKLGGVLWAATGDPFFRTVETCQQIKRYCTGLAYDVLAQNVRVLCPITCGCADPLSGLWNLAAHFSGCPWDSCQWVLEEALKENSKTTDFTYECRDRTLRELQEEPGWSLLLAGFNETGAVSESEIQVFNSTGCSAFQDFEFGERQALCSRMDLWDPPPLAIPLLGGGVMCPESCRCYYDYGERDGDPYEPGDQALCPMQSCWQRYLASYHAHQQAALSDDR